MKVFIVVSCLLVSTCLCSPKDRVIKEPELSTEEHFKEGEGHEHNPEYDHEAFLGKEEARAFEELTPEESKERLGKLFDKVDKDSDGFVTEKELKDWIHYTQNRYILSDVEKQMKQSDTDKSGSIDWEEYKKSTYGFMDEEGNKSEMDQFKDMLARDEKRFNRADKNGDKILSTEEFGAFLHPENHEDMKGLVIEETLDDIDKNKDGSISLDEYIGDLYPESEREKGEEPEWVTNEKKQFKDYRDKNGDGKMDKEEVADWILPPDFDHVSSEAKHLMSESDVDKDQKLSKQEMVEKYDLFVGSQATDFGEALKNKHDEF